MSTPSESALKLIREAGQDPDLSQLMTFVEAGVAFSSEYTEAGDPTSPTPESHNPLWDYFTKHSTGPGIWKWKHYFDMYHRHFQKFIDADINLLEVGIYSGGSLAMWRHYFGELCTIYGIDIEDACKAYENEFTKVFIGDQEDPSFWESFRAQSDTIDILIDDGGHTPAQQRVTLEQMLPHIRPGGIYICEDIHGLTNPFTAFATNLVNELNQANAARGNELTCTCTSFQRAIHSIHFYPFAMVIEKHQQIVPTLCAPRHGTKWQPFFNKSS